MKRRLFILLPMLLSLFLALSACAWDGAEEPVPIQRHTVTFCDNNGVIRQCSVADGERVSVVPEADGVWLGEDGGVVEPSELSVTRDMVLRLRYIPERAAITGPLMSGDGPCFRPDASMTRGETARLLSALVVPHEETQASEVFFTDISRSDALYDAVETAAVYELMEGYADGTFRPDRAVTRAEFTAALFRLSGNEGAVSSFGDVPADHWASAAIGGAARQGWITGYDDGNFYPEGELTRAQAAVMLGRFLGRALSARDIDAALEGRLPYVDVLPTHWAYGDIVEFSYRNELLTYLLGEAADAEPGFVLLGDKLCHVNPETLCLDRYEEGFQRIDGGLYRVSEAGFAVDRMSEGLYELEDGMYYVPEDDGPFMTDGDYGYLHFGEDGRYTSGGEEVDAAVEELLEGIIGNDAMTHEEKLYAGFLRVRDGGFFYRSVNDTGWARGTTDWSLWAAWKMFTQHYGTCYYWAAAFLYVARRLGFQAYPVAGGVGSANQLHAWVMVEFDDGQEYICDVELEWAYRHNFYNGPVTMDSMFKQPLYATNAHYIFPSGMRTVDYGNWITYDDDLEEGEGDFLDIPEEDQVPQLDPEEEIDDGEVTEDPGPNEETPGEEEIPGDVPGNTETGEETPPEETTAPADPEPAPAEPDPAPIGDVPQEDGGA